jgi:hypothetical protein
VITLQATPIHEFFLFVSKNSAPYPKEQKQSFPPRFAYLSSWLVQPEAGHNLWNRNFLSLN